MQRWEKRAHRWHVNAEQRRLRRKSGPGDDADKLEEAAQDAEATVNEVEGPFPDVVANPNEAH